jgi:hypothetical protein
MHAAGDALGEIMADIMHRIARNRAAREARRSPAVTGT